MLGKAWGMLFDWLKAQSFWIVLQPYIVFIAFYIAVQVFAYQYILNTYGFDPSYMLFKGSRISLQIDVLFLGILAVLLLFRLATAIETPPSRGRMMVMVSRYGRVFAVRASIVLVIGALVMLGFHKLAPQKVSHIRIVFMADPQTLDEDFLPEAFAYLVYELNRYQKHWYLELDFKPFDPDVLSTVDSDRCAREPSTILCYAEAYAKVKNYPIIAITSQAIDPAYFASHRGDASVISTIDRRYYAPLTTYEYLAYCVLVQSILIHLDSAGDGLPDDYFDPSTISRGGVFQFSPRREAIKSVILAARLSPNEEQLLFNRFGPQYVGQSTKLLSMEWFHEKRIQDNLARF